MSKSTETKNVFIELRAAGESYASIARTLHISKSTCSAWETELSAQIALRKQDMLNDLYTAYGMVKAARIKRLGDTLNQIDGALRKVDLSTIAPEKLLAYKLKYAEALKNEYTGAIEALPTSNERGSTYNVYYACADLFDRVRNGEITQQQAKIELASISAMQRAHDGATNPFADLGTTSTIPKVVKLAYNEKMGADKCGT